MDIRECVYCGNEFDIDDETAENLLWPCEVCGMYFCEECFKERHGESVLRRMVDWKDGKFIACPDCFPEYKHEIFPNG